MRKKFLSAILFSVALTTMTGTFVSCKDYDDDIDNLQEQIDKKALSADVDALKTQLTSAQSDATAAKTAAADAKTKAEQAIADAKTANDAVKLAAAQADLEAANKKIEDAAKRLDAIEEAMEKLDAFKAELQKASDDAIEAMNKKFEALKLEVEGLVGTMVTNVSLFLSEAGATSVGLSMTNGTKQETTFGDKTLIKATSTEVFAKGDLINFENTLDVRVSPTNADLTKATIKLINSKGEDLSELVSFVSAKPYDGLISRAAGNNTGLWTLTFKLTDAYTAAKWAAATIDPNATAPNNKVCFAIAIGNTTDEARTAVSTYDVIPAVTAYTPDAALDFTVDKVAASAIHTRYNIAGGAPEGSSESKSFTAWENKWVASTSSNVTPTTAEKFVPSTATSGTKNGELDLSDQTRQGVSCLPVSLNKAFTVRLPQATNAYKYYVTLDTKNAVASDDSEYNAWTSYGYAGLNTMTDAKSPLDITITQMNKAYDVIGFRVYAVNYDGTLVDPDGKAFYVTVGESASNQSIAANIVAETVTSSYVAEVTAKWNSRVTTWTQTGSFTMDSKNPKVNTTTGTLTYAFYKDAKCTQPAGNASESKYIKVAFDDASKFVDGGEYKGSVNFTNAAGNILNTINVDMTKVMPTTFPSTFKMNDGMVVNGIMTLYMDPATNWTTASTTSAIKTMSQICGDTNSANAANYKFEFGTSKWNATDKKLEAETVTGLNNNLTLALGDNVKVDGTTQHATTISYLYNGVSSYKKADGTWATGVPYSVKGQEIQTVYACYFAAYTPSWQKVAQGTNPETYKEFNTCPVGVTYTIDGSAIKLTNSAATSWSKTLKEILTTPIYPDGNISVKLLDSTKQKEEWFNASISGTNIVLTKASNDALNANITTYLTIKITDAFGHENVYELPFTLTK